MPQKRNVLSTHKRRQHGQISSSLVLQKVLKLGENANAGLGPDSGLVEQDHIFRINHHLFLFNASTFAF